MPVCFQLYRKGFDEPEVLQKIDDVMREHFGALPDKENWFHDWYGSIGLRLACGKTLAQIREEFEDHATDPLIQEEYRQWYVETLAVLDYIEERYTPNSYYSPFKD